MAKNDMISTEQRTTLSLKRKTNSSSKLDNKTSKKTTSPDAKHPTPLIKTPANTDSFHGVPNILEISHMSSIHPKWDYTQKWIEEITKRHVQTSQKLYHSLQNGNVDEAYAFTVELEQGFNMLSQNLVGLIGHLMDSAINSSQK